jgi:hypothetical protein
VPLTRGRLYGLMHRGRGLLLDRTGGLSSAAGRTGWTVLWTVCWMAATNLTHRPC